MLFMNRNLNRGPFGIEGTADMFHRSRFSGYATLKTFFLGKPEDKHPLRQNEEGTRTASIRRQVWACAGVKRWVSKTQLPNKAFLFFTTRKACMPPTNNWTEFSSMGLEEAESICLAISLSTPSGVGSVIQTGMTLKPFPEKSLKYSCAALLRPDGFRKQVSTRSTGRPFQNPLRDMKPLLIVSAYYTDGSLFPSLFCNKFNMFL